ncbi:hypothetical protein QLQ12_29815 [Actinoplanes sp. NEAU-A12]|uniref:DUF4328 domain-containing protein n=1 Tax=Actinoplanes sandaracinus TaxID=3045177 RepID=A0ABT6WSX8_9ACTN|nr:hypothetical protein [Actinoplanes sandaracinus]MDI6102823.1 hypothetical protein [Actinoplanes sandaracinus]
MTTTPTSTARPTQAWEIQTIVLMAAIGASALLSMVLLVSDLVVRSFLLSGPESGLLPLVDAVARHGVSVGRLFLLATIAALAGFLWWRRATRSMLSEAGDRAGTATSHWTIPAWYLSIGAALTIRSQNKAPDDTRDALATMLTWDAVQTGIRLAGLALLLVGVWKIRARVRGVVAETGVAARRPSGKVRLLPPPDRPVAPAPADLGPADDAFWQRVGQLAGSAGGDLALLETTGAVTRRWVLVPSTGELTAVRAALPPGAVVTAFPEPPAATDTTTFAPAPADFYHGFLEDGQSGALRYQVVSPDRMPVFLDRARHARRWALYPTDSRTALHAVVEPA